MLDTEHMLNVYEIVIYKKHVFGHPDDQKCISHIYLVFAHNSWLTAPQNLGISQVLRMIKVSFVM